MLAGGGCIISADESRNIASCRNGNEGKNMNVTGVRIDTTAMAQGEVFTADVYGESCCCMYKVQEGYTIAAVMPRNEAALSCNAAAAVTFAMQIIAFAALSILIYVPVKKLAVNNILKMNGSLTAITDGKLDTVADVHPCREFAALSNDINSTADTLKRISDAKAWINAKPAFTKGIRHFALPSVFPSFSGRKEFAIRADMDTAGEMGGDFYDFYFRRRLYFVLPTEAGSVPGKICA
jgi:hypothetical protein